MKKNKLAAWLLVGAMSLSLLSCLLYTSHIKNKDALVRGITLLILSLHWFNPLVYLFFKMINESNEICCDDKVAKDVYKRQ